MPIKLNPPREGKSPNYTVRGTYLGFRVDRTTGSADRKTAKKYLEKVKRDIESGAFTDKALKTFADGALSYVRAGGEKQYIGRLADHFGTTAMKDIDQAAIDEAAHVIYPNASAATRNRQVYTPVSAILKHNGIVFFMKRPKGAQGQVRVDWIWPEQAGVLFDAAGEVDAEFRLFLILLTYCGPRLSEALRVDTDEVRLSEAFAFCGRTKNGSPRPMHLPPIVVAELANHPRGLYREGERLFRFSKNGHLYGMMADTRAKAKLPVHVTFHTLRHTWGTWMRRYGGLDAKGLVGTGAWLDEKSAARYSHVIVSEEAQRADLLPPPNCGKRVENGK